jgi:hypothetical protein
MWTAAEVWPGLVALYQEMAQFSESTWPPATGLPHLPQRPGQPLQCGWQLRGDLVVT